MGAPQRTTCRRRVELVSGAALPALETRRRRLPAGLGPLALVAPAAALGISLAQPARAQVTHGGTYTGTFTVTGTPGAVTFTSTAHVSTGSIGPAVDVPSGSGWTIINDGTIDAQSTSPISSNDGLYLRSGGSVVNSGSINSNGYTGVAVLGEGHVENLGTITAKAYGIFVNGPGTIVNGSTVNATAVIHGDQAGIGIFGGAGSVTNYGTIEGNTYGGVQMLGGGTIDNQGTILSPPTAVVIFLVGRVVNGSTTNAAALIKSTTQDGVSMPSGSGTVTNYGTIDAARYGAVLQGDSTIVNQGTVSGGDSAVWIKSGGRVDNGSTSNSAALLQGSAAYGVKIEGAAGTLTNHGTITGPTDALYLVAGGTVWNYGSLVSAGLVVRSDAAVTFANGSPTDTTALIRSTGTDGLLVASGSTVTNYGTIDAARFGVVLQGDSTIVNHGSITSQDVAVRFNGAASTLKLETGSSVTGPLAGIGGHGIVILEGTGSLSSDTSSDLAKLTMAGSAWTLSGALGATDTEVKSGTLRVDGTLSSTVQVDSGAVLSGSGTITGTLSVLGGGKLRPGPASATGTLTQTGNLTFAPGSTLEIAATPSSASKLAVSGTASLAGTFRVDPASGDYSAGPTYVVVTANTLSGTFGTVTSSDASLLPTLTYDSANNRLLLTLTLAPAGGSGSGSGSGSSTASGDTVDTSQAYFTFADPAGSGSTVTFNGGTLKLTGSTSSGQGIVVRSSGGTIDSNGRSVVLSGNIDNSGTLAITGGGDVELSGTVSGGGTTEVTDGALHLNGSLDGILLVDAGGMLRGSGTVSGPTTVSGTLRPGNSPGTLTFTAPVTLAEGSTLALDIDGTGTGNGAGNYSRVVVQGASISVAGTIAPVLRGLTGSATNSYTPPLGERFEVISADGGVFGSFSGLTQPGEGLTDGTRFDALYGTDTLTLVVTPADYGNLAPLGLAQTDNEQAAGTALQDLRPAAGLRLEGDAGEVFSSLYGLDSGAIDGALDQVAGAVHGDAVVDNLAAQRQLGTLVQRRLAALRGAEAGTVQQAASDGLTGFQLAFNSAFGGILEGSAGPTGQQAAGQQAAGPADDQAAFVKRRLHGWVQGFGSFGRQDEHGAPGYDATTGGAVAGADFALASGVVLGGTLGYAHSELDSDAGGHAGLDVVQAGAYAGARFGKVFLDAQVSGAWSRTDTSRTIDFGGLDRSADSSTDGYAAGGALRLGYSMSAWGISFEPSAGLRYDHLHQGSFSESGAGDLSLSGASGDLDALRSTLGIRADTTFDLGQATLVPEVRLGWAHELADVAASTSQRLAGGGGSFTVESNSLDRDSLLAGAGLSALVSDNLKVFADYGARLSSHGSDHTVAAGLKFTW